jgi:hypothetical protein
MHKLRGVLLVLLMPILASCETTTAVEETDIQRLVCQSFARITWSPKDTDQTIREVKEHNAVMKSFKCPG